MYPMPAQRLAPNGLASIKNSGFGCSGGSTKVQWLFNHLFFGSVLGLHIALA